MLGLSIVLNSVFDTDLFIYCLNNPINDRDITGYVSAKSIANMFSVSTIFSIFASLLYVNTTKGLAAVSVYATKIVTPVAIKSFWRKPVVAGAIIVAAVAIIVAGVGIYYSNRQKEVDKAKKKIPKKLMKNGKIDLSQFNKRLPKGQGWGGPDKWKIVKDTANHAGKTWKLYKYLERIASLLEDGTIYGK